ncbi:CRISPR-associated endoribonuclease Cas6 [Desulfolucanica intricata]|uniref:CRISPR-associated endoribonuclease Cas6 n=1 Tax=Desulfolucanica intricata TaxID=1285191 RepID=UPI000A3F319D|nr:CRISPR-associated endoribonuclease Cas6 [Desulfolucanica intricata]
MKTIDGDLTLPIHYNHLIQAFIYDSLGEELASFLHNSGFIEGKRAFKMFTFSRIQGKFQMIEGGQKISFTGQVKLTVSSPMTAFCNSLVNRLLLQGEVRIGKNYLKVTEVRGRNVTIGSEQVQFRTVSPIVLYSTLLRPDGRKYTCYFQPDEPDYEKLLENNLRKKYSAFYKEEAPEGELRVRALGQHRLAVIKYKETVIKGYSGKLMVSGPIPLLQMAVDSGLGSKNSQGFGCVEIAHMRH